MSTSKLTIRNSTSPRSSPHHAMYPHRTSAQGSPLEARLNKLEDRTERIEHCLDQIFQQLDEAEQTRRAERENSKIRSLYQRIVWMPVYNAEGPMQLDPFFKDMPALRFYNLHKHCMDWLLLYLSQVPCINWLR
ncbi:uncharacterized protein N7483_002457 [Penicillium malachiteum]|uniref:uncharacterized protein n=1 Tax=Penicillium malachiteum TaxID=1324776 RepID=UPI002549AB8A|nr:uncharacterized protein N7483_002457 [Penicillium malachiteum]KAJ5737332.1 hypothetical protein N7483_002457 [Penicillium malachiteum]